MGVVLSTEGPRYHECFQDRFKLGWGGVGEGMRCLGFSPFTQQAQL